MGGRSAFFLKFQAFRSLSAGSITAGIPVPPSHTYVFFRSLHLHGDRSLSSVNRSFTVFVASHLQGDRSRFLVTLWFGVENCMIPRRKLSE